MLNEDGRRFQARSVVTAGARKGRAVARHALSPGERPNARVDARRRAASTAARSSNSRTRMAYPMSPRSRSSWATRPGSEPASASFESTSAQFTALIAAPRDASDRTPRASLVAEERKQGRPIEDHAGESLQRPFSRRASLLRSSISSRLRLRRGATRAYIPRTDSRTSAIFATLRLPSGSSQRTTF